ncbi:MAG TPA: hypothetical protein VFT36_08400 [Methylomirabilota bacterium]|nr:hypothetical protein [Methylomirabilota bacterium]
MTRCLSDDALTRVLAELATDAERAHLAACAACARRSRGARHELASIAGVLRDTPEPRPRVAVLRRRWLPPAVGLSALALALLMWVEVAVWRAVTPVPPTMQPQEAAAILADVSASLFSLTGNPRSGATLSPGPLEASDDTPVTLEAMARQLDSRLTGEEP